jgi:ferredoxin, 2Fe-2S
MVSVIYKYRDGKDNPVEVEEGDSLMMGAVLAGLQGIPGLCGGVAVCGTCHLWVADEWLGRCGPPGNAESHQLANLENRRPNSRLSCQIAASAALDGLVVTIVDSEGTR